ncbi:hypothetical protein LEMLEM_LOCUS7760 [Lemmus lemmus]
MHLLWPGLLWVSLISILTVAGEWAALQRKPGPARAASGSQVPAQGRRGGPGRATQCWGLRVFILSFLFSLYLLQDLKGQPRPRRRARRPRFLRSPDALCGPAGPAHTGALAQNCREFLGAHHRLGAAGLQSLAQIFGARFLQGPVRMGN